MTVPVNKIFKNTRKCTWVYECRFII